MAFSIHCSHCQIHTALSFAPAEYVSHGSRGNTDALWEQSHNRKWWIGICNFCNQPSLVLNEGEEIYPKPFPSPTDSRISEPMRSDLIESKVCHSSECYRACAVMARRAIQTACIEKGAKKKKLVEQIEELYNNGIITKNLKYWADVVRWVGNDAAHPNPNEVDKEGADDIMNLAEQFLHVLYVAPAIASSRKNKRTKK